MYIILTSKPGQYRTEPAPGMQPVERYDYLLCGRKRTEFVLAEMHVEAKVTVIEEGEGGAINHVPSKFLPRFSTLEEARAELKHLAGFGTLDIELVRVA